MTRLQAVHYRAADGSEPVNDFIDRLSVKRQVALDNQIERLNILTSQSPHLPFPHSSQVEGELRELRCHFGREHYRILYRRSKNLRVLLHAFRKDTGKIPDAEIRIAKERWADFSAPHGCPGASATQGCRTRRALTGQTLTCVTRIGNLLEKEV